jgi:hypothetical protein
MISNFVGSESDQIHNVQVLHALQHENQHEKEELGKGRLFTEGVLNWRNAAEHILE